jgi:hypothetical protein
MMSRSGVTAFDNDVRDAEVARQAAMVAGVSQSAANSASITFYKSVITSAVNNSVDIGPFIHALRNLGQAV